MNQTVKTQFELLEMLVFEDIYNPPDTHTVRKGRKLAHPQVTSTHKELTHIVTFHPSRLPFTLGGRKPELTSHSAYSTFALSRVVWGD